MLIEREIPYSALMILFYETLSEKTAQHVKCGTFNFLSDCIIYLLRWGLEFFILVLSNGNHTHKSE